MLKKPQRKLFLKLINILIGMSIATIILCVFLFIGYAYALQSNPNLYIPMFSEKANTAIGYVWGKPYQYPTPTPLPSVLYGETIPAPEISGITHWYNTETPLTLTQFRGQKIVVLTFGRIYCSFCLNIYTVLNEYQRQYAQYVQVIGIQSPHYEQEKIWEDVLIKIKERNVIFPIGLDENTETSKKYRDAYQLNAVPVIYIIDKKGIIRYSHLGEGGYSETEKALQEVIRLEFEK